MDQRTGGAVNGSSRPIVCYSPTMIATTGIWEIGNPLDYSIPLFILQITLIVSITRLLIFILRPFRQPPFISEIIAGVILGPSVLGQSKEFNHVVFPFRSIIVLEAMANLGVLYFLFLVGVEMDVSVVKRTGRKSLSIAVVGMTLPFLTSFAFSYVIEKKKSGHDRTLIVFLGVALSVTAFPVLARILAELKLINTELGRIALSSALISDICAWILLAFAIALAKDATLSTSSLWVILSCVGFVLFCFIVVRPAISRTAQRIPDGEEVGEFFMCIILTGVMIAGLVTDALGTHSVFGAFVFGLIIPNGPLGLALMEKLEDFISGLLLPLFFALSGLKTNITAINGGMTWTVLIIVIILGSTGKVVGTLIVTFFNDMPIAEGLTLGLLMNTKGLVELIVLNVGKDQKILDDEIFAMMIIAAVVMTAIISPTVSAIHKPMRRLISYKQRTIQKSKTDAELKVVVCVHMPRNVPTMINLLEVSHPNKMSPLCIYVLHLVELTGRESAMLIVHNTTRKLGKPALNRTQAQSHHIISAFQNYEQHASFVSVQPLTVVSPYSTMHEDVCQLAEDKRVSLLLIPFHKQLAVDGGMESTNPAFRTLNQNLLANAPCSVGILVDRGLTGSTRLAFNLVSHNIAVLFFGGPDDREALAYGWRMSEHPSTNLTLMRFISSQDTTEISRRSSRDSQTLRVKKDEKSDKKLDEDYISRFRIQNANDDSIFYAEIIVNNGEETLAAIRSMDNVYNLLIVGRGEGMVSPLTAGLTDWSECPELGAIGDLLASSDFAATASVLVMQQYVGFGPKEEGPSSPDSPVRVEAQNHQVMYRKQPTKQYQQEEGF